MKKSRKQVLQDLKKSRDNALEKVQERISKRTVNKKKPRLKKPKSIKNDPKISESQSNRVKAIAFECSATFADERDKELVFNRAEPIYTQLAKELTVLAQSPALTANLVWPAFPSCVPAIHSIATCAAYQRGHKTGLRALFYPAKSNTFRELNHIRIDAQWLYSTAQSWQTKLSKGNYIPVESECEHKDFLYLSLHHYLDDFGDPAGYPSVGETFPTFPVGRKAWGNFEKKIFNGVFKNVPKKGKPLQELVDPAVAPDSIFGVHPDLNYKDIMELLQTDALMKGSGRSPDVAVVCLDTKSRMSLGGNWAKKAAKFTCSCLFELPYSPIGVQVFLDDPIAYLTYRKELNKQIKNHKGKSSAGAGTTFKSLMSLNSSIAPTQSNAQRTISDTRLIAHVVDAEAAAIAAEFSQAARVVQNDSDAYASALRDCGGYLLWSARLPMGQAALQQILHDDSGSDQELQWKTKKYSWTGVLMRLEDIRSQVADSADTPNVDKLIEKANALLASYVSGTPSGVKLHDLIAQIMSVTEDARSKKKKRGRPTVTIAVPTALQIRLLYDSLEKDWSLHDEYGNSIIQIVRTADLFSRNAPVVARRLIVLGARAQTIAGLCSGTDLPKRIDLITSAADAERIVQRLDFILKEIVFEPLHGPVSTLVDQLKDFLESASTRFSILSKLVYWRPQTHVQTSPLTTSTVNPDYEIQLDDGRTLGLFKTRPVLIYDETRRPPFAQRNGLDINIGDNLLVISDEMRSDISVYMDLASRFKNENIVRKYHEHVQDRLRSTFPELSQTDLVETIRSAIQKAFPGAEGITEHKVRYWVTVSREIDLSFDDLRSHAPATREDFDRFTHVLGIDDHFAEIYWTLGITSLRTDRRHEGRQATLVYQRLLLDSTSVAALLGIPADEESRLLVQARTNVFEVIEKRKV